MPIISHWVSRPSASGDVWNHGVARGCHGPDRVSRPSASGDVRNEKRIRVNLSERELFLGPQLRAMFGTDYAGAAKAHGYVPVFLGPQLRAMFGTTGAILQGPRTSHVSRPSASGDVRNPTPGKCLMANRFQRRLRAPRDFGRTKVPNAKKRCHQNHSKSLPINTFRVCAHLPHFGHFQSTPVTVDS